MSLRETHSQIVQRALAKGNGLENDRTEVTAEIESLRDEVASLEPRISENDDDCDYYDLMRGDKVGLVREHVFEKASWGSSVAPLDYDRIMWEVFDGESSADHYSTLMELVAWRNPVRH